MTVRAGKSKTAGQVTSLETQGIVDVSIESESKIPSPSGFP